MAVRRMGLSARAHNRILKLSRTIATESPHPVVNGAPQRHRSRMGGGPIHVNVDSSGGYRAAWSVNWLGRNFGTNVRYKLASNLPGPNASEEHGTCRLHA